jgi:ribosomal protein L11 methylase PrmA
VRISRKSLLHLTDNLRQLIEKTNLPKTSTTWGNYYSDTNYSPAASDSKYALISSLLEKLRPDTVLDMGANTGRFSRLAGKYARFVLAADMDALAVEYQYRELARDAVENILPLVIDVNNPSPSIGWLNKERPSFIERCKAHTVLALALIHHLCIGNNLSLPMCAELFASLGANLILEFVPKDDSQVQRLLATRQDIFPDYTLDNTIAEFSAYFHYEELLHIQDSNRCLILFTSQR